MPENLTLVCWPCRYYRRVASHSVWEPPTHEHPKHGTRIPQTCPYCSGFLRQVSELPTKKKWDVDSTKGRLFD